MGGRKGDREFSAEGLEQGGWGLGRVSKGLGPGGYSHVLLKGYLRATEGCN